MNLFQLIVCPALGLVCLWELVWLFRRTNRRAALIRLTIWLLALTGVAFPTLVQQTANLVGIGRGADIVLYGLVFAFLFVTWWFYGENHRLRRNVTELVRLYALDHARRKDSAGRIEKATAERQTSAKEASGA